MTTPGWVMMFLSAGFVIGLLLFCFYRVLTTPRREEHLQGALDLDPRDPDRGS